MSTTGELRRASSQGQCPVVVDDVSETFRAGTAAYEVPSRRHYQCYVATDSAAHVATVSQLIGIDTRLVFGVYLQETTGCRDPARDGVGANIGRLGSAGASNLPRSSFEETVRRNPHRFGFASADDISGGWLDDRFKELPSRRGDSPYNLAYATASRLRDIYDDLGRAMRQRSVRSITRQQARGLAGDGNYRVYRESALVGQAYTSVQNDAFRFFIDIFRNGDKGNIDAAGSAAHILPDGSSGYSEGFDATCSTFPFRC